MIAADERRYIGHYASKARHTQQVDYFDYQPAHAQASELPAGRERARRQGPVRLAGRAGEPALS